MGADTTAAAEHRTDLATGIDKRTHEEDAPQKPPTNAGAASEGEKQAGTASHGDSKDNDNPTTDTPATDDLVVYMTVYPPADSGAAPITLEPLSGGELVMQVRQLLGEIPQTCIYSAFMLVAVKPPGDGCSKLASKSDGEGEGEVMNDYAELRSISAIASRPEKVEIRMELDIYTTHSARVHVQKFRDLLRYPPPCPDGFRPHSKSGSGGGKKRSKNNRKKNSSGKESKSAASAVAATASGSSGEQTTAGSTGDGQRNASGDQQDAGTETSAGDDRALRIERAKDIRSRLKDCRIPVAGQGLGAFYGVGLGLAVDEVAVPPREEMKSGSKDKDKDGIITCLRGVAVSPWNPPPPQRKMVGDLIYLEVTTLDGAVIHITGTQEGFYVNGTKRDSFDPTPADNNPCHAHELATCLLACSPSFAKAWNAAVTQAWRRTQADDPVHALARAMQEGRGDAVMVKPQWNCPVSESKWGTHTADPSRAQEDLTSGFGMDDRGVPREWNDEYQCLLELPNDNQELTMTRSRALYKLLCDFQEAATAATLAIIEGHIPPANPTEVEHSHVYVFNNIFFSYAADSPDAYKAVTGEAAARKSASQDLASVVALNSLAEAFHPQLNIKTLATAVIDQCGRRVIAQSLVPGILNGDQTSKVVYGAMEHGQALKPNEKVSQLLREVGQKLMIAEREVEAVPIKALETPSPASDGSSVPASQSDVGGSSGSHSEVEDEGVDNDGDGGQEKKKVSSSTPGTVRITGAVEMKGIVGSDSRSYLLDVSRLTPRDANWVRGDKGTGVYDKWLEIHDAESKVVGDWEGKGASVDLSFENMAVLRPELLTMFTRHKVAKWFRGRDLDLARLKDEKGKEIVAAGNTEDVPVGTDQTETNLDQEERDVKDGLNSSATSADGNKDYSNVEGGEAEKRHTVTASSVLAAKNGSDGSAKEEREEAAGHDDETFRMSEGDVEKLKLEQEEKVKEMAMNVNVFMPYKGCVDAEQLAADEELAREAARYLWDDALPFITTEVKRGSLCPMDCAELAAALHSAGINLRYMGNLAAVAMAEEMEDSTVRAEGKLRRWRMPLFWLEMLETEMTVRAATHVFNRYMAGNTTRARSAPGHAIHQFLNCLLGQPAVPNEQFADVKALPSTTTNGAALGLSGGAGASPTVDLAAHGVTKLSHKGLWASIMAEVAGRFRHGLNIWGKHTRDRKSAARAHKVPLLRRLCQRLGLRVLSKTYDFNKPEPFTLEDIVSTFPVVKSCVPTSPVPDAAEALEMAQLHLGSGGGLQTAHDLAQHAASMLFQACDGMHSKYPAALTLQARVMFLSGDAEAAIVYQLKALAYFEQLEGLDSSQVIKCHEHLGQYCLLAGQYDKCLAHMRAFCYLVELTAGPNHPELGAGYFRMGRAYQDMGSVMMALRCYQEALERQAGDYMINPRVHHNVAETLESIGGYTDALKHERLSHAGLKAVHGEDHPAVIKSTQNIRNLTTKIVKAAQEGQQTKKQLEASNTTTSRSGTAEKSSGKSAGAESVSTGKNASSRSSPPKRKGDSATSTVQGDDNAFDVRGVEESKDSDPPSVGTDGSATGGVVARSGGGGVNGPAKADSSKPVEDKSKGENSRTGSKEKKKNRK